jgi:hypothetical protein
MLALIRRLRKWLFLFVLVLLIGGTVWVVWNRPRQVDMAAYVPADQSRTSKPTTLHALPTDSPIPKRGELWLNLWVRLES